MAQFFSHAHIDCVLRTNTATGPEARISGWADEERPVEIDDGADLFDKKRGADGGLYGSSKPMYGGPVTFRLQPNSPWTQWFIQRKQEWKNAQRTGTAIPIFEGSYGDTVQGRSITWRGGIMDNARTWPNLA